jgi:hypothetical protein
VLSFQVTAGHVVEKQPRRILLLLPIAAVKSLLDLLLARGQIVQGIV